MYVCWDVHQDTYLDIWVRRVIILIDTCYELLLCQLWIFDMPYHICLYWILHRISGFMVIIILAAHTLLYPLYPPASCSFSYHAPSTVGLYVFGLWWHEIKVYRWWFPCLDYSFDVPVLWSRDLIILISHKKDNLHGEWEEVMDAGMMPCL